MKKKAGGETTILMKAAELITVLKEKIANGYAGPDGRLPNIGNIAKEFSVSPMTAQKAIKVLVEAEILSSTRGKGVYLKQRSAAATRIGIVTMNYCEPGIAYAAAYASYITPAVELLKNAGCRIQRYDRDDLKGNPATVRSILKELDGMIITIGCLDAETLPHLLSWEKPVVLIQQEEFLDYPFSQIIPDRAPAFQDLLTLLNTDPPKEVLIINNGTFHLPRIRSFLQHLRRNPQTRNAHVETITIQKHLVDLGCIAGQQIAEKVLKSNKKYDLIFSPSDFLTFGFIDVMNQHGKQYGVDYDLVSYDNLEDDGYLPFEKPIMTCIDKRPKEISEAAAKLLLNMNRLRPITSMLCKIPCRLVLRETFCRRTST